MEDEGRRCDAQHFCSGIFFFQTFLFDVLWHFMDRAYISLFLTAGMPPFAFQTKFTSNKYLVHEHTHSPYHYQRHALLACLRKILTSTLNYSHSIAMYPVFIYLKW
jgi:hypothetical protein